MTANDVFTVSRDHAKAALMKMEQLGIPPTPENFAVWYAYQTGNRDELNKTIDGYIGAGHEFSDQRNAEIHRRFFDRTMDEEALFAASRSIEASVARMIEMVTQAGQDTTQFGDRLSDASGRLAGADGPKIVAEILTGLVADTRAMQERASALAGRLDSSSREVAQLRQQVADMRTEAETDALTGLANRRRFDEALRASAREAMQNGLPLSLAMIDIDHFKKFNDTHGHALGDQVLKLVARTIAEHCRDGDVAARYGGEEFVLVMPKTGIASALEVAERVRLATASKRLTRRGSKESLGGITMSVGVARYQNQEALTNLVERADAALYAAKNAGRNQVKSESELAAAS